MIDKLHIALTAFLLVTLTSCIFCYFPREKVRQVTFDYSDREVSYTFRTGKNDFIAYCLRLPKKLTAYNDSLYSIDFQVSEERIIATAKALLTSRDSITKITLQLIDTLTYYPPKDDADTSVLYSIDKLNCLAAFEKTYIPDLNVSVNNCIKIDSLYRKGLDELKNTHYEKSYALFEAVANNELLKHDLISFERYSALNRMAYIKNQQNQYDKAIELLNKALTIEPWWLNLGHRTQFRTNGRLPAWVKEDYVDELKSEYKYNSENTEQLLLHANLAIAYLKVGKQKESRLAMDKTEKLYPSDPYLTSIKKLYE